METLKNKGTDQKQGEAESFWKTYQFTCKWTMTWEFFQIDFHKFYLSEFYTTNIGEGGVQFKPSPVANPKVFTAYCT